MTHDTAQHTGNLCLILNSYRKQNLFCDVTLKLADGSEYPAHRVILAASSQYFHTSFTSGFDDSNSAIYNMNNISSNTVESLLEYFYSGNVHITHDNVSEMIDVADFMFVENLKLKCRKFILSDLNSFNYLRYYILCKHYFDKEILSLINQTHVGLYGIFEDRSLLHLGYTQVKELIQDKILKDVQEKQLVSFILRWAEKEYVERKNEVLQLLSLISWEFVPPVYLKKALDLTPIDHELHDSLVNLLQERDIQGPVPIVHLIRSRAATAVCCGFIPSHDKWLSLAPIPVNICGCVLKTVTLSNKLYVLCCKDQFAARIHKIARSFFMCYDPMSNEWNELACPIDELLDLGNIDGMSLFASNDTIYFTNTRNISISKYLFGENKWQKIPIDGNRFHCDDYVKIVQDVMFHLGMNRHYGNYRYTLIMVDLSSMKSEEFQLETYCLLPSGKELPFNRWPKEYQFEICNSYNISLKKAASPRFSLLNDFHETVLYVDVGESKIVFCFTPKADNFRKRDFQTIRSEHALGHVFLASSEDRSCGLVDINTGFFKYVEENPLFPTYSRKSFNMSNLCIPSKMANRALQFSKSSSVISSSASGN